MRHPKEMPAQRPRSIIYRGVIGLALGLWLVAAADLPGCALEGTGGRAVFVELELSAEPMEEALGLSHTPTNPAWTIELEEAVILVGAVYFFPPPLEGLASRLSLLPRALAHAGDDNVFGVSARAEYLDPIVVDALDPEPQRFGPLIGEQGTLEMASVWLDEPRGDMARPNGPTRGHHAFVRGRARQGEREIRFEAGIDLENTPLRRRVDNIEVGGDRRLDDDTTIRLVVRPDHWLRHVDFDFWLEEDEAGPDADGVYRPEAPSLFHSGFRIGFHNRNAFRVETVGVNPSAGEAP